MRSIHWIAALCAVLLSAAVLVPAAAVDSMGFFSEGRPSDSLEAQLERLREGLRNAPGAEPQHVQPIIASGSLLSTSEDPLVSTVAVSKPAAPVSSPAPVAAGAGAAAATNVLTGVANVKQKLIASVDNIGQHLNNIVDDVSSIVKNKKEYAAAVGSSGNTQKVYEEAARKLGGSSSLYLQKQKARTSKDVIDCTACRYAWMQVEVDLGNTYNEKALYDSFVYHCGAMQQSRLFYAACNDMFVQVDDMIGDYLNGHTVNQLCMNARLCR